jgi:hypothetical protein
MRVRILTLGLALVIGGSAIGCKSAPKLPWFKSANTATAGAATATTASNAPQLPSEIAKQAEGLAAGVDPVKITTPSAATTAKAVGGAAPAYTATAAPSAYPTTGAQDYLSSSAAALKSAAGSTVAGTAAAAKGSLPYDPMAVPPSSTTAASSPASAPAADRYGMPSQDRYANTYPTATPAYTPTSYPASTALAPPTATQSAAVMPATPATSSVPFPSNPDSASLGDRYATQSMPAASPVSTAVPSYTTPVQPASAVASVQPYRPGGTGSYPGTSANYEVATRPGSTSTGTNTSGTLYR